MKKTTERLASMLEKQPARNSEKLQKQQDYYKRLTSTGVAVKQNYNLKAVSAI